MDDGPNVGLTMERRASFSGHTQPLAASGSPLHYRS